MSVQLHHPALYSLGVELCVPGRIERVREIDAAAVAADLHHLRRAIQWLFRLLRMRRVADDPTQMNRACFLRMEWIGNVVLQEFTGAKAGNVQEAVIEREIDVRDQRRYGFESLQQGRQFFRIGRLGGNLDYLFHSPVTVGPMPYPD